MKNIFFILLLLFFTNKPLLTAPDCMVYGLSFCEAFKGKPAWLIRSEKSIWTYGEKPWIEMDNVSCIIPNFLESELILNSRKVICTCDASELSMNEKLTGSWNDITFIVHGLYYNRTQEKISLLDNIQLKHSYFHTCAKQGYLDINDGSLHLEGGVESEFIM